MEHDFHRKLNILVTGPSLQDIGGVANYLDNLFKSLDREKVELFYIPIGRSSSQSPAWFRPIDYLTSLFRFVRGLFNKNYDLIHLNPSLTRRSLPLNLLLLLIAKSLSRIPVIIFFHGWEKQIAVAIVEKRIIGLLIKGILKKADYFLVLSDSFRETLIKCGFPPNHIEVSTLIVKIAMFSNAVEDSASNNDQSQPFKVLFLSRIERDKGARELSDAILWIQQTHPETPFEFTIAGSGTDEELLKTGLQREINIGLVKMPGYLIGEEKIKVFQKADLYVFPSRHPEGFPTTILEAMAAGLPLIYTPVGALTEVLGPENGLCIQLTDLSGITLGEAIWDLCLRPDKRLAMSNANQKLIREKYNSDTVCEKMLNLYRQVSQIKKES